MWRINCLSAHFVTCDMHPCQPCCVEVTRPLWEVEPNRRDAATCTRAKVLTKLLVSRFASPPPILLFCASLFPLGEAILELQHQNFNCMLSATPMLAECRDHHGACFTACRNLYFSLYLYKQLTQILNTRAQPLLTELDSTQCLDSLLRQS